MNEAQIKTLLSLVAAHLHAKGKDITIVAVGGAVNTVLLHSRLTTGDVDFFYNTKQQNDDVHAVVTAAEEVAKEKGLGDAWLNNHTAVFMQESDINALYEEAKTQNTPIFKETGLTVLAAPWRYAMTTKLDRLMKTGAKPYDLADAVTYLHQIVSAPHGQPVPQANLLQWASDFKCTQPSPELIQRLAAAYVAKYSSPGLS